MKIHSRYTPEYTFCYYTCTTHTNLRECSYSPWVRGYVAGAGRPLTPAGLQPIPAVRRAKTDSYWIVWYLCSVVLQEMHLNETLIVSYSYFWHPSRISRNSTGTVILWRNNQLIQHQMTMVWSYGQRKHVQLAAINTITIAPSASQRWTRCQ